MLILQKQLKMESNVSAVPPEQSIPDGCSASSNQAVLPTNCHVGVRSERPMLRIQSVKDVRAETIAERICFTVDKVKHERGEQ